MSASIKESFHKTGGMKPWWIMALLLVLSEAVLHVPELRQEAVAASEQIWLQREVSRRVSEVVPLHQDLAEQAMNEAYLRGLAGAKAHTRIIVAGDSTAWQAPDHVIFYQELGKVLDADFPGVAPQTCSLAMPGMNHVAAYYLLKAMLSQFRPALVIYVANPSWSGQVQSDTVPRGTGFMDGPFFSPDEEKAHERILINSRPENDWTRHFSFTTAHDLIRIRYGSALRSLMLPPAVFTGLSSRCYSVECQDTDNVYWKDLGKKREKRNTEAIRNLQRFILGEQGINYDYLMLLPRLMAAKGVPLIVIIPPKNREFIEEVGASWQETMNAGRVYAAEMEKRGVTALNCTSAIPESQFRDTQHLRAEGVKMWVQYIRGPLEREIRETVLDN